MATVLTQNTSVSKNRCVGRVKVRAKVGTMAGLGHLRRFEHTSVTSAGTPKPTFACTATSNAVGQVGSRHFSFEHFVGTHKEKFWDFEPERLGGFEIDNKFEFCRLLERQVCRLGSSKYLFYFRLGGHRQRHGGPAPGLVPLDKTQATPFKFRVRDSTRSWQTPDQSGASGKSATFVCSMGYCFGDG